MLTLPTARVVLILALTCLLPAGAAPFPTTAPANPPARSPLDQAVEEAGAATEPAPAARADDARGTAHSFASSWALFRNSYLTGWFMAVALSLVGVLVVARDQIFIGAALSQASALGVAVALLLGTWAGHGAADHDAPAAGAPLTSIMAVAFAVGAALLTARGGHGGVGGESHEAVTGWIFLVSASLSVLLISRSPHGLEEIQRLASSSLIGATAADVWVFAAMAVVSGAVALLFNRRILLLATDPAMAAAVGMRTGWWSTGLAAWLGVVVGLSIRVSGMLYTFGLLVLPALLAKQLCREVRPMFLAAPVAALAATAAGFVLADRYDFPPGQMSVALLALLLPAARLTRAAAARLSARRW